MTLDVKARATALRLITKFGKAVSYVSVTDGVYDPATGAVSPTEVSSSIKALIVSYSLRGDGFTSGLIREGDRKITFAASGIVFSPKVGDKVSFDSETFAVLNVSPTYSGELVAIYTVRGRKS